MSFVIDTSRLRFVDVEASGFGPSCYPIEVGWADIGMTTDGVLIRPHWSWAEDDWYEAAERVHGLSRDALVRDGVDLVEAATRVNDALRGATVLSDAPGFDARWLRRLFVDAGVRQEFVVTDFHDALGGAVKAGARARIGDFRDFGSMMAQIERRFPYAHRAQPDALQMAATWRAMFDPAWRAAMLGDGTVTSR